MTEELPQVKPERGQPPPEPLPANIPFVDPQLVEAVGFRLCHVHTHSAEEAVVTVAILCKGMDAGDAPGKSMMRLNGLLAKGYKVVHCWKRAADETQMLVLIFGNV